MVNEIEKYKEDKEATAHIQSKNGLKLYTYNLCNSLNDNKLKDKSNVSGYGQAQECGEQHNLVVGCIAGGVEGGVQKELETITNPIMQKLYSMAGAEQFSSTHM